MNVTENFDIKCGENIVYGHQCNQEILDVTYECLRFGLGIIPATLSLMICTSVSGLSLLTATQSPCLRIVFQTGERM